MRSAAELLEELNVLDESVRIEAKRGSDSGKSVQQTVCAFANEPGLGGGYLLLGAEWTRNDKGDIEYWAVGVPDPDKVQRDLASQCASMFNVMLRPEMQVEAIDGKPVIVVHVPEADVSQKPVYFKATGLPGGAYRRTGSADQRCADEDLWVLRGETQPQSGPAQIIHYSNRIEVLNPGYSLKPVADLGTPGSRLRNPMIAAVLHDLHWAETKGTGIRTMRHLATRAGLPLPEFSSARQQNEFKAIFFLHNLLTEDDHRWLKAFAGDSLGADEAKILVYARETGAVDNTACRDFSGLDTLNASVVLRRLRERGLLVKQGSGSRTYYTLASPGAPGEDSPEQQRLPFGPGTGQQEDDVTAQPFGDTPNPHKAEPESPQAHAGIPQALLESIAAAGVKPRRATLRALLLEFCALRPFTAAELCQVLCRSDPRELTRGHLKPMREDGQLELRYPESIKHPHQAYFVPEQEQEEPGD